MHVTDAVRRTSDLSAEDLDRLATAHRRLRDAVMEYERRFVTGPVAADEDAPVLDAAEMSAAQLEAQSAERELWRLREELLGWSRPTALPSALQMAEWFSDEDAVYDDGPGITAP